MNKPNPITPELFEKAKELYALGFGAQTIKLKLNVSESKLRKMLHAAGIMRTLSDARKVSHTHATQKIKDLKI